MKLQGVVVNTDEQVEIVYDKKSFEVWREKGVSFGGSRVFMEDALKMMGIKIIKSDHEKGGA